MWISLMHMHKYGVEGPYVLLFLSQLINPTQRWDDLPYAFDWVGLECECTYGTYESFYA